MKYLIVKYETSKYDQLVRNCHPVTTMVMQGGLSKLEKALSLIGDARVYRVYLSNKAIGH